MYEPLWTLKDGDAYPIYRSVLQHLLNEVGSETPGLCRCWLCVIAHESVEGCNHIWLNVRADDFLIQ